MRRSAELISRPNGSQWADSEAKAGQLPRRFYIQVVLGLALIGYGVAPAVGFIASLVVSGLRWALP